MIDLIFNHLLELAVGFVSTLAVALWGYLVVIFRRNDAKLNEFVSLPKAVQFANNNLEKTQVRVVSMQATLSDLHLEMRARADLNIDACEFTCDHDGSVTNVNQTFARWLGVGKQELLGWGWINYVHPEDRERVRQEWSACIRDHRTLNIRYRLVEEDGDVTNVHTIATPIPDAPPARQWIGVIRKDGR